MDERVDVLRHQCRSFGRGVDAVRLHRVRNVVHVIEDEGQQRHIELFCSQHVCLIDGLHVVRPIIGRKRNAGQHDFDSSMLQSRDDLVEVGARGRNRQAAQHVIAAELDHGNRGMCRNHASHAVYAVLGRVAAYSKIKNTIVIPMRIQNGLQHIWIGVPGGDAVASRKAVSKAGDNRRGFLGMKNGRENKEQQRQKTLHI